MKSSNQIVFFFEGHPMKFYSGSTDRKKNET